MVAMAQQSSKSIPDNLLGEVSEARVMIEGIDTRAFIDTGSMISTVSSDFYRLRLSHIPLEPLTNLVKIECAMAM